MRKFHRTVETFQSGQDLLIQLKQVEWIYPLLKYYPEKHAC